MTADFRTALPAFIAQEARPVDKFGHQPRLEALTREVAAGCAHDADIVFAAAWLHDLGVFVGHRPEDPEKLSRWDHVAYACQHAPRILRDAGFPEEKIPAVLDVIRQHQPKDEPLTIEAVILRDADILEQLGAVGIFRTVSKVGRDTRFAHFSDAAAALRRALDDLPKHIRLDSTRRLAEPRIRILQAFLDAADDEAGTRLL
ncbi:HD domain-containing protein [Paracidobacterium acidisoli]|uniref:HD domain-containing protein n=1 Tax=Paracidobacterium acidisoli TaxID=2303751 RepID=A0A372IS04_9BACT|nr:HD domain-containing protein [Paracidobacterium acidisoli]MBT9330428.1 HD domain-containing protein [Paracidobacterium acidisoli]